MTSKFNKIPLIISIIVAAIVSWLCLWLGDGGVVVIFGVKGSIFWLFWLDVLNPLSETAGNSAVLWVMSVIYFWLPIGIIGGKLCKKNHHIPFYFLVVLVLTVLLAIFLNWTMLSGDAGSQIWTPMWPVY